jgi:mRNA-degrading endonuclease YafQ of YafQ-DinJ toxin-antitoxin module
MLTVSYKPSFIRKLNKLDKDFREEIITKISLLGDTGNHAALKVHKLHGRFSDCFSFSVNYETRIVFEYISKTEVALLSIGTHDIYR